MIVIAGICTQPVMSLFFGNIPSSLAWILSFTASYYAYEVEQITLGYFIVYALICIACGLAGTPLSYIKKLFPTKQKAKMLLGTASPPVTPVTAEEPKESWREKFGKVLDTVLDTIQDSVVGPLFTLIFIVPIAILDTIIGNIIFNDETKEERQIWNRVFRKDSQFYEYDEVYGKDFDEKYNKEELWIHINGILTDEKSALRKMLGVNAFLHGFV